MYIKELLFREYLRWMIEIKHDFWDSVADNHNAYKKHKVQFILTTTSPALPPASVIQWMQ